MTRPLPFCTLALAAWLSVLGCGRSLSSTQHGSAPPREWLEWKAKRLNSVRGPYGWASLAGLHWLPEGSTWVGAHPSNQLVLLPKGAPTCLGKFERSGSRVDFTAHPSSASTVDGKPVTSLVLASDMPGPASVIEIQGLRIVLLQRGEFGDRMGLRVRDPNAPSRRDLKPLQYFPYNPKWRFEARFEPHPSPEIRRFADVTGGIERMTSPGTLVFSVEGTQYRLDVVEDTEEKDLFILFRDQTSGRSTYGSGRFVHAPMPDAQGRVVLDFNYAYTPPCAFTPFATCPLPSRQNHLPLRIEAGERGHSEGH